MATSMLVIFQMKAFSQEEFRVPNLLSRPRNIPERTRRRVQWLAPSPATSFNYTLYALVSHGQMGKKRLAKLWS
jgi:hypothetical protein